MIEERADYLAFLIGMWINTRELVGKPSVAEALGSLKAGGYWTKTEREEIVCVLAEKGELGEVRDTRREMWDAYGPGARA